MFPSHDKVVKNIEGSCDNLWSNKAKRKIRGVSVVSLNYSDGFSNFMLDFAIAMNSYARVKIEEFTNIMMNRKIGITLAVVAVLIGTMLLIPILFKGKIIDKIKSEANQSVNAKIDFGKVDLSLLRSFPKLSIQITNFEISGINQFEGQKLATVKSLAMTTNLSSLWNSGKMEINKIVTIRSLCKFIS